MNFEISAKDIFSALSKTRYQRGPESFRVETKAIKTIFLETPIPETKFLHVTEKMENLAAAPPPPKKQPQNKQNSNQDIYAILRQAQGITSTSGPKKGVGSATPEAQPGMMPGMRPMPYPMQPGMMPGMDGHGIHNPGMRPMPRTIGETEFQDGNNPFATNIGGNPHHLVQPREEDLEEEDFDENND